MTLDYKTYQKIKTLLALLDSHAVTMYHDYDFLSPEERKKTYEQQLTITRALVDLTGLKAHEEKVREELKQEQLRLIDEHKEHIEEFASTVSQELTAIKDPVCYREYKLNKDATNTEDLFEVSIDCTPAPPIEEPTCPNATKEEWLTAIELAKNYHQKAYEESKQYQEDNPDNNFFPPAVLKEVFVDEDVIALTKGFMTGPVGMFNNKLIEAGHPQKYDNIHEMLVFLGVQAKTKDVIIYLTYKAGDKYFFRGAFIDKI